MQRNDPSKLDIMKIIDVICIVFISRETNKKKIREKNEYLQVLILVNHHHLLHFQCP
jgi:hypothetical protein